MNRKATYFKSTGGYSGAVKIKGKWWPMPCLFCAIADTPELFVGPRARRWQGPASKAIRKAMAGHWCIAKDKIEKHKKAVQIIQQARK